MRVRALGGAPTGGLVWQERRLPKAAREDRLDVFFSPAYSCPLSLALPRVTAVHDLSFFSLPQDFTFRDGLRRRLLVARSLRASRLRAGLLGLHAPRDLRPLPGDHRPRAHGPLGADDDLAAPPSRDMARTRLGVRGPLVLTVGAILNRRRLPELLRAMALLRRRLPEAVLDVVGENRTHPRLDPGPLARRLGLAEHVRFSGFVDEAALADRFAAADVAVFLSDYEGFGLPALEAAARGVPLVASGRPSLDEILGDAALFVDPADEDAIAEALARVLTDDSLRSDLRERGRARAARYSWADTAARTREAIVRAAAS